MSDRHAANHLALFRWPGLAAIAALIVIAAWFAVTPIVVLAGLVMATGLVARAWANLALVGLTYERNLTPRRAFPGETIALVARLDNRKPLPLSWVQAEEILPDALCPVAPDEAPAGQDPVLSAGPHPGTVRLSFDTPLRWYTSATLSRTLLCSRRGWYRIPPARLSSTDVFGVFDSSRTGAGEDIVVVYPRLLDLDDPALPARQPFGATRDPRRLFEDTTRPMGLRDYTPETPFKAVSWKATARTGTLQARIYEPTVTLETAIFLNVDGFTETSEDDLFELAVSAAATLAHRELSLRRSVGLFANGTQSDERGAVTVPTGRHPDQDRLVLEHLARIERSPSGPFGPFLDEQLRGMASGTTLTILGNRFADDLVAHMADLRRRGRPITVIGVGDAPLPETALPCRRLGMATRTGAAA